MSALPVLAGGRGRRDRDDGEDGEDLGDGEHFS